MDKLFRRTGAVFACLAILHLLGCRKAASPILGVWQYENTGGLFNSASVSLQYSFHPNGTVDLHFESHAGLTGANLTFDLRWTWKMEDGTLIVSDEKGALAERMELKAHTNQLLTWKVIQSRFYEVGGSVQWQRIGEP